MQIGLLFLQITLIVALGRMAGAVMARLGQPRVLGEILAGIALGPSLLGRLWPVTYAELFPAASWPILEALAQLGVVFFVFLVGLELDPRLISAEGVQRSSAGPGRGGSRVALIAAPTVLLPLVLGIGTALGMHGTLLGEWGGRRMVAGALFLGVSMSVTAFPVLARILTERNLQRTPVGAMAICAAVFDDIAAWWLFALAAAVAQVKGLRMALGTVALSGAYVALMFAVARPLLRRIEIVFDRQGRLSQSLVWIVFLLVVVSAYATRAIGIHPLLGAFLTGYIMPKGTQFVRHLSEKLEDFTVILLLPIFLVWAGIRTELGLLNSTWLWGCTALLVAVATVGKVAGGAVAGRAAGLNWREASAVGILLNTRGVMPLIVLTAGLQLHAVTPALYAMAVVMTLVATAMTPPLMGLFYPGRFGRLGEGTPERKGQGGGFSILIPVSLPKSGAPLVQLADTLIGHEKEGSRLLAIHLRKPTDYDAYRSGLDEASPGHDESLAPLLAQARGRMIPVEQVSFVSRDVPGDIASLAKQSRVNLVLMGFHKPVIGKQILGGTVHRVLQQCEADVAIFVDRGFRSARRVLVPYLGSGHDKLALTLAARMARSIEAEVTVLHVVPPMRTRGGKSIGAREAVDRVFHEPGQDVPVTFRVIEDESPAGVVLHQAQNADLVIIGVAEEWGLESHLFGWRAQRIARDCPSSLLIVRRGDRKAV